MKKIIFFIFIIYVWIKTFVGLIIHPFISIRKIIRRPVLTPVILSPFLGLIILFLLGRIAALFIPISGLKREIISIILSTSLISIILWQILLIYLLISLLIAFLKTP